MSDDKTERPTDKRLRDARKKGQVSHSADLTMGITMAAVVLLLAVAAGPLTNLIRQIIADALGFVASDHLNPTLSSQLYKISISALAVVFPCVLAAAFGALAASVSQVGLQISMTPISPNLSNVNPVAGFKRMFSPKTLVDLIKMTITAAIMIVVMWLTIRSIFPLVVASLYRPVIELASMFWKMILKLLIVAAAISVITGAADAGVQKFLFLRNLRMSKDEIKRERKQSEGDPRIKSERRRLARQFVKSAPPPVKIALADVMVVNPTHYAVALRYVPDEHPLPRVIAKGSGEHAAVLRRAARDANVPIIGNPPVARALFQIGVDQPIPEELFETVAAILRWVQSIGERGSRPTPDSSQ